MNKLLITFIASLLLVNPLWSKELSPALQEAKSQGINYYMIWHCDLAEPLLLKAAEAGDSEAQYYYGDCLFQADQMLTQRSAIWFQKAAEQGDIYAMMRLGATSRLCEKLANCPASDPQTWREQAEKLATEKAQQGDGEGMWQLYLMTGKRTWLEQSAKAGYALAQYRLAMRYDDGEGFFITGRKAAVEKWMKAAAEQGDPKAMLKYAYILSEQGKAEEAKNYLIRSANTGFTDAIYEYAAKLRDSDSTFNINQNFVKSYAFFSLLICYDTASARLAKSSITKRMPALSKEQLEQAEVFAEKWEKTHPPLSEYFFKNEYQGFR